MRLYFGSTQILCLCVQRQTLENDMQLLTTSHLKRNTVNLQGEC